jgi:zinc transport system substrate-binding protein
MRSLPARLIARLTTRLTAPLTACLAALAVPAAAEVPQVVTDTPVTHALVAMVMGDLGMPDLLLDKGADAHDFQLRPSQRAALAGADLVFWIGAEMTPWLDRALQGTTAGTSVPLLDLPGLTLRQLAATQDAPHHDHDDAEEGHDEPQHHHDGSDPHAWLDPDNAALWLDAMAEALAARDAANAATYRANAEMARSRLAALAARIGADLAGARAPIVTAHDALGYFADRFGLTIAATVAAGDAAGPGAAHLSELRARIASGEIACIFPEAGLDPRPVETLAEGTPARVGGALDPEGRALEPGTDLYLRLLDATAATIRDCLTAGP